MSERNNLWHPYFQPLPKGTNGHLVGTEHLCITDTYQGEYYFPKEKEFSIVYKINGPSKNWRIETKFEKL